MKFDFFSYQHGLMSKFSSNKVQLDVDDTLISEHICFIQEKDQKKYEKSDKLLILRYQNSCLSFLTIFQVFYTEKIYLPSDSRSFLDQRKDILLQLLNKQFYRNAELIVLFLILNIIFGTHVFCDLMQFQKMEK